MTDFTLFLATDCLRVSRTMLFPISNGSSDDTGVPRHLRPTHPLPCFQSDPWANPQAFMEGGIVRPRLMPGGCRAYPPKTGLACGSVIEAACLSPAQLALRPPSSTPQHGLGSDATNTLSRAKTGSRAYWRMEACEGDRPLQYPFLDSVNMNRNSVSVCSGSVC